MSALIFETALKASLDFRAKREENVLRRGCSTGAAPKRLIPELSVRPAVIAATGLYTPPESISNAELVESFNTYAERFNAENAAAIAEGRIEAIPPSSAEFIEKASGIKSRFVMEKTGILDPAVMRPVIPERPNEEISILAEMAVKGGARRAGALGQAARAHRRGAVRGVQHAARLSGHGDRGAGALGLGGFAFDMNVACSSATFGIKTATDYIATGSLDAVLVVNPEICSGHLNFRDRDSHFIFGDVATAVIVERGR